VLAAQQEKEWADYLFRDGSMIGLNKDILCQYVEYITNIRMQAGLDLPFQTRSNPSRGSTPGWCPITCRLRRRKWK
jgi:ribonucleoside-diphosphate reductase beta chain